MCSLFNFSIKKFIEIVLEAKKLTFFVKLTKIDLTLGRYFLYSSDMRQLGYFAANTYSQFGEDGLIFEILGRISSRFNIDHWCCEFGAWDGLHLSNTAKLIREKDYRAVLIEGDRKRLKDLEKNFPQDNVIKICSFVSVEGTTSLDNILEKTEIPMDFDFLSIDIDGMDYFILQSLTNFRPKLICIEYNPTIPNSISFVQERNQKIKQGSSAKAILELGNAKGYTAIYATYCNVLLLKNEYVSLFTSDLKPLEDLIPKGNDLQVIFSGYDGTLLSNKLDISLGWHGTFDMQEVQILPKYLRKYSGDYTAVQRILFRLFYLSRSDRKELKGKLLKRVKRAIRLGS